MGTTVALFYLDSNQVFNLPYSPLNKREIISGTETLTNSPELVRSGS